jgi:hypothetical protein
MNCFKVEVGYKNKEKDLKSPASIEGEARNPFLSISLIEEEERKMIHTHRSLK